MLWHEKGTIHTRSPWVSSKTMAVISLTYHKFWIYLVGVNTKKIILYTEVFKGEDSTRRDINVALENFLNVIYNKMGILRSKCKTIQLMYKQESSRFCYLRTFIRLIDRVGIVFPSFENIKIYMYKDVTNFWWRDAKFRANLLLINYLRLWFVGVKLVNFKQDLVSTRFTAKFCMIHVLRRQIGIQFFITSSNILNR